MRVVRYKKIKREMFGRQSDGEAQPSNITFSSCCCCHHCMILLLGGNQLCNLISPYLVVVVFLDGGEINNKKFRKKDALSRESLLNFPPEGCERAHGGAVAIPDGE